MAAATAESPDRPRRGLMEFAHRPGIQAFAAYAVALIAGIAIGHFLIRQQFQLQQGVVLQLQQEIRGLTGDVQRLELASTQTAQRYQQAIEQIERMHRLRQADAAQASQVRLESLERLVLRQIDAQQNALATCLAEFEPYRRRRLAVPIEQVADALERMMDRRTRDLHVLAEEVDAQSRLEERRLTLMMTEWAISDAAPRHTPRPGGASLTSTLPEFPYTAAAETQPRPEPTRETSEATFHAKADAGAPAATPAVVQPAPRIVTNTSRRPRAQLLSFASGRRIEAEGAEAPAAAAESTDAGPARR